MTPDFELYFESYAALYNKALTDVSACKDIMARFSDCFIAAGPAGVKCGENNDGFRTQLEQGAGFHKQIGTKRMTKRRCEVTDIDATHHMVKVFYHADYEKDGKPIGVDFDVTYLLDSGSGEPKIFAFIAGDEMGAYRQAGLID
jgi:hypothetical protein